MSRRSGAIVWLWVVLALVAPLALAAAEAPPAVVDPPRVDTPLLADTPPYVQHMNVVYADTNDGVGLIMDIFTPTGKSNGCGVIDVVSGSWSSARGRLEDHKRAQLFDIMCGRGYTVFAVRPGSSSKYSALEMLANLKLGIRWVKANAAEYNIDPEQLVISGASAGGHLASLAVVTSEDGNPDAKDPLERLSTRVKAAVVFFPPTDFVNWGGVKLKMESAGPLASMLGNLLFPGGVKKQTSEEVYAQMEKISPARLVTGNEPPFLFIHGDADRVVPLQQSKTMIEALEKAGVATELIIKKGGGHPWPTIHEEIEIAADWIDRQLKAPHTAEK